MFPGADALAAAAPVIAANDAWVPFAVAAPPLAAIATGFMTWWTTKKRDDVAAEQKDRDQTLAELKQIAAERAGQVLDLRGDVAAREATIAALRADIATRDTVIAARDLTIERQAVIIATQADTIARWYHGT